VEALGHLLVAVAAGDVAEHLALAGGELVELGVEGRRQPPAEGVEDEAREARREDGVAVAHGADGGHQVGRGDSTW
jgi:hypothetical protein